MSAHGVCILINIMTAAPPCSPPSSQLRTQVFCTTKFDFPRRPEPISAIFPEISAVVKYYDSLVSIGRVMIKTSCRRANKAVKYL